MGAVLECARLTKQLYDLVHNSDEKKDRDRLIQQIDRLLDQREQLLPEIAPPFSEKEKKLGRAIMQMNQTIDVKLQKIKSQIEQDIVDAKKTKTSVQKYVNPYESLQTDGVYYDKKN